MSFALWEGVPEERQQELLTQCGQHDCIQLHFDVSVCRIIPSIVKRSEAVENPANKTTSYFYPEDMQQYQEYHEWSLKHIYPRIQKIKRRAQRRARLRALFHWMRLS